MNAFVRKYTLVKLNMDANVHVFTIDMFIFTQSLVVNETDTPVNELEESELETLLKGKTPSPSQQVRHGNLLIPQHGGVALGVQGKRWLSCAD